MSSLASPSFSLQSEDYYLCNTVFSLSFRAGAIPCISEQNHPKEKLSVKTQVCKKCPQIKTNYAEKTPENLTSASITMTLVNFFSEHTLFFLRIFLRGGGLFAYTLIFSVDALCPMCQSMQQAPIVCLM